MTTSGLDWTIVRERGAEIHVGVDAAARERAASRWLLVAALAVNVLLFLRVAVLYAPSYSYRGPSGADRVFYYAYARSLVVDRDVAFDDEMAMRPPSSGLLVRNGHAVNKYPIGSPFLSLPAFSLAHVVLSALSRAGVPVVTDGYSPPYVLSYALSQMACGLLGVWLLYLALLRYFRPMVAAAAVVAAWYGTNALHYTAIDLMMSHAAALFSTGWCAYEAVTLSESRDRYAKWCRLGVSCALVGLVRQQNAVFLLVPLAAAMTNLRRLAAAGGWVDALTRAAAAAAAGAAACVPQALVWRAMYGKFLVNSYGEEFDFSWMQPHLAEILTNPVAGLPVWLPLLAIGVVGCAALAVRRRDAVVMSAAAAWVVHVYVVSTWWAWAALVPRATFDLLLPIALGVGALLAAVSDRWRWVAAAGIGLLIAWSVPFAVLGAPSVGGGTSLIDGWLEGLRILL